MDRHIVSYRIRERSKARHDIYTRLPTVRQQPTNSDTDRKDCTREQQACSNRRGVGPQTPATRTRRNRDRRTGDRSTGYLRLLVTDRYSVPDFDGQVRSDLPRSISISLPRRLLLRLPELESLTRLPELLPIDCSTKSDSHAKHGLEHAHPYRNSLFTTSPRYNSPRSRVSKQPRSPSRTGTCRDICHLTRSEKLLQQLDRRYRVLLTPVPPKHYLTAWLDPDLD